MCQRPLPKTGWTLPTVACCWVLWTQSWWEISAWAGAASPKTAAAKPVAMALANPNFFMVRTFLCRCSYPVDTHNRGPRRQISDGRD
ncbi:hypothetical protein MSMEI_0481 [Mycolicibacterium smegmatis MC2 155]|uniref:Uncharacterized protein n=1 Tax=Mycolicibacterium smegmatis (strain ATCC 700084 / mc(2)155) TaxID=246196 RepID=I7FWH6_MYCS2|nr:hypothetical protein MSMEI_0481 [Mycolicibacterium smegmatis MC2 155]